MYREGPNIQEMKVAAKKGDPKAAFDLGWCYYTGNGVGRDTTEARKWYSEAAERGVREADEILHILEAEAQRASELRSLQQQEKQAALRGHRTTWVVLVVLVAVSVGSVGTLVHVFNRDSTVSEEPPRLGRDEAPAQGPEPTPIDEGTDDVATVSEEPSIQDEPPQLNTQTSSPNSLGREPDTVFDFNDVARFAEKWLDARHRSNTFN